MTVNNSPDIRMSLPAGTVISGTKGTYTAESLITMSDRSLTVRANDSRGQSFRLKLFNGKHSMTSDILKRLQMIQTNGAILPYDTGTYSGLPFAVYPQINEPDTGSFVVAQSVLIKRIIPQIAWVMNQYHNNRILLRDICPRHILFSTQKQMITYTGFSNAAVLADQATVTKAPGFGQEEWFVAPEVNTNGYSRFSDYFALGVTLLCLVKGKNPLSGISASQFYQNLNKGIVPGIDVAHLRNTPYEIYTEEDKIHYLILGLLLPDPKVRWEFGEIQCWCNNQHIPLVRPGGRIRYQYNEPFTIGKYTCWNYQQLTQALAAEPSAWNDKMFDRLNQFAVRQNIPGANVLADMKKDSSLDGPGRIFTCIYLMNPALDGLWWKGKKYKDTNALIQDASGNKADASALSELLKNGRLSFFLERRSVVSKVNPSDIREFKEIENWERQEPGKGVSRCIMRFAQNASKRSFFADGKEYTSFESLLMNYRNNGLRLKTISPGILKDQAFQAWLWANGMDEAGKQAALTAQNNPAESFYLLLNIAETCIKDNTSKQLPREIYLHYGEFAPVYWLIRNISIYKPVTISDTILFDTFKQSGISLSDSLKTISSKIINLVPDYHHFVSGTAENALAVECVDLQYADFSFYPTKEDCYFCSSWENWDHVTPAFLRSVGLKAEKKTLDEWIVKSKQEVHSRLSNIISQLPTAPGGISDEKTYLSECNTNMAMSVLAIVTAIACLIMIPHAWVKGLCSFIFAVIYPIMMFRMYHSRKSNASYFYNSMKIAESQRDYYRSIQNSLDRIGTDIVNGILNGNSHPVKLFQPIATQNAQLQALAPADLNMSFSAGNALLSTMSAAGFMILTHVVHINTLHCVLNFTMMCFGVYIGGIRTARKWTLILLILLAPILYRYFMNAVISGLIIEVIAGFIAFTILKY